MSLHPNSTVRLTHWCICVCMAISRLEQQQGVAFTPADTARRLAIETFVNECSTLSADAIKAFEPQLPTDTLFDGFDRSLHGADLSAPRANLHPSWLIAERFGREVKMDAERYLMAVSELFFKRLAAIAAQWDPRTERRLSDRLPILPQCDKERLRILVMDGLVAPIEERVALLQEPLLLALADKHAPLARLGDGMVPARTKRPGAAALQN